MGRMFKEDGDFEEVMSFKDFDRAKIDRLLNCSGFAVDFFYD